MTQILTLTTIVSGVTISIDWCKEGSQAVFTLNGTTYYSGMHNTLDEALINALDELFTIIEQPTQETPTL